MKGALLFAFNNGVVDYYEMAVRTAKRIQHFLNIPISVVTDESTIVSKYDNPFDKILFIEPDTSNVKGKNAWINKGRYNAYDLSPYDETLLLDTDYLVNSPQLLQAFNICTDFVCPNTTHFLFHPNTLQDQMSPTSFQTLWATVIVFRKTNKSKQLFECMKMVQENYMHYVNLYNMYSVMFRNDYALTISHRIVNGHYDDRSNYIPWSLVHAGSDIEIHKVHDEPFNTEYVAFRKTKRNEYIKLRDTDFHCMNKETFMRIV